MQHFHDASDHKHAIRAVIYSSEPQKEIKRRIEVYCRASKGRFAKNQAHEGRAAEIGGIIRRHSQIPDGSQRQ